MIASLDDKYDLSDAFQIVSPQLDPDDLQSGELELDPSTGEAKVNNPFLEFNKRTLEEMRQTPNGILNGPMFRENVALSYEWIQHHIEPGKIMEDIMPYRALVPKADDVSK